MGYLGKEVGEVLDKTATVPYWGTKIGTWTISDLVIRFESLERVTREGTISFHCL